MTLIPHNKPTLGAGEEAAALRVLRSGWVAQGAEVAALEEEFCSFLGLPDGHAVAVSSGTAALFLALHALEVRGRRVALPAYSCHALKNATCLAGGIPRYLDNAAGSPNLNPGLLKESGASVAVVPHTYGIPLELIPVPGLDVVEDCAQALGATVNGLPVGLQGRLGVFSFYATKLITSGGQGGMVVSRERDLADAARDYREFDCRCDDKARFNFQMTDLQAAIGRVQLGRLPEFLGAREALFGRYREAGIPLLDLPAQSRCRAVRTRAVMLTRDPAGVIAALEKREIRAIVPFEVRELLETPALVPCARLLAQSSVSLPLYPTLSGEQADEIIRGVKST